MIARAAAWRTGLAVAALLAATSCQRRRVVKVQYGPSPDRLSVGFGCRGADGMLLITRAPVTSPGTVTVSLVIDLVDLGGNLPSCRGESLLLACPPGGPCHMLSEDRYCQPLELSASLVDPATGMVDQKAAVASVEAQLADRPPITTDAPDRPLVLRAVLTAQTCDNVAVNGLLQTELTGCAYSCPFVPDTLQGSIEVGLDTLDYSCETQVDRCAGFP